MLIIEENHLTKEYQLGHLTRLKETAFDTLGEGISIIGHNDSGNQLTLVKIAGPLCTPLDILAGKNAFVGCGNWQSGCGMPIGGFWLYGQPWGFFLSQPNAEEILV